MDQTADAEYVDDDGYPTDAALERLRTWPMSDMYGAFDFLRSVWWASGWGWHEPSNGLYRISTGGWSGNEDAMYAFKCNPIYGLCFRSVRAGGHYDFQIPRACGVDGGSVGDAHEEKRGVIIIPIETWNQICREIPALATTQFEVGSYE